MNENEFLNIESKYKDLKSQLESGAIDKEVLKSELKKLMVRDEQGNYWMIGSNTGKWYFYDGKEWKEKNPYAQENNDFSRTQQFSHEESKAVFTELKKDSAESGDETSEEEAVESGSDSGEGEEKKENVINLDNIEMEYSEEKKEDEESESSQIEESNDEAVAVEAENTDDSPLLPSKSGEEESEADDGSSCIVCKSKISKFSVFCNFCGANQKELGKKKSTKGDTWSVSSFNILSLIFFLGGFGLIFGILFGAAFGIFNILPDFLSKFPQMLIETRGKIQGGLIFAAIGGIGGFLFMAVFAAIWGIIYNSISYLFGGIKFKVR